MGNLETFNKREYAEPQCEKPKTNADRIRNMTDEELAEFMITMKKGYLVGIKCVSDCYYCISNKETCKNQILQWLQAEVKEGGEDERS